MGMMGPAGLLKLFRLLKPSSEELDEFGPTKAEQILGTSNPVLNNEQTDDELIPNDMPSLQAYRDYLSKGAPKHEDYQPSTGRRVLAGAQGFLSGISRTPNKVDEILTNPYTNAVEDYEMEGKGLEGAAKLDVNLENQRRLEKQSADAAKSRMAEIDREIAQEKANAERSQRNFDAEQQNRAMQHVERLEAEKRSQELALKRIEAAMSRGNNESPRSTQLVKAEDGTYVIVDKVNKTAAPVTMGGKPLEARESDKVRGTIQGHEQSIAKATEMLNLFDKLSAGGSTGHVGPVQGWLSKKATETGVIDNPDVNNLHQLAQELSNSQLYAMSGAQINNKEYERLRQTLPDTNKGEKKFRQDIERFIRYQKAALAGWLDENTDPNWTLEQNKTDQKLPANSKYKVRLKGGQ